MGLVGSVPARFNNRPATTVTDFDIGIDRPGQVKAGGYGVIGTSEGVETGGSGSSFNIAIRQENGLEFDLETLRRPFTMAFPLGPRRYVLLGCKMTSMKLAVQQKEGNTTWSVNFIFEQMKQSA